VNQHLHSYHGKKPQILLVASKHGIYYISGPQTRAGTRSPSLIFSGLNVTTNQRCSVVVTLKNISNIQEVLSSGRKISPNFDLKNMILTYIKDFPWKKDDPNSLDFFKKVSRPSDIYDKFH